MANKTGDSPTLIEQILAINKRLHPFGLHLTYYDGLKTWHCLQSEHVFAPVSSLSMLSNHYAAIAEILQTIPQPDTEAAKLERFFNSLGFVPYTTGPGCNAFARINGDKSYFLLTDPVGTDIPTKLDEPAKLQLFSASNILGASVLLASSSQLLALSEGWVGDYLHDLNSLYSMTKPATAQGD